MLIVASILAFLIGLVHSVLGEIYLISRLLNRDNLPKLFASDDFTKRLIRFAWHLTTIAWWGLAAILWVLASPNFELIATIQSIIAMTFLVSASIAFIYSKGKHLSWIVFLLISLLSQLSQ